MRKPNSPPMTAEQMQEMQTEKRGTKIYKQISDKHKQQELSRISARIGAELDTEKISLVGGDMTRIKEQVNAYFAACSETGTLPSATGLARALGHSRSSLYKFLDLHGNTPIGEYLTITRDAISDALDTAALQNCVDTTTAIFIQKSIFYRIDRSELFLKTEPPPHPLDNLTSEEDLRKKYLAAVPEID